MLIGIVLYIAPIAVWEFLRVVTVVYGFNRTIN